VDDLFCADQEFERASGASRAAASLCQETKAELEALVPKNFLDVYTLDRLVHVPRYLEALKMRLSRGKVDFEKDRKKAEQVRPFIAALERLNEEVSAGAPQERRKGIEELRWMVEEYKVALFAPELRTAFPVSPKRLGLKIKEIEAAIDQKQLTRPGKTL